MAILYGEDRRRALQQAKARVRELEKPAKEAKKIAQAAKRRKRESALKNRHESQRDPRQREADFMAWMHEHHLPCIACLIAGEPEEPGPMEMAHQNIAIAAKGWRERGLGKRIHDARAVPLCAWHHQRAPNACDKGQRKFWDRHGIGDRIADLCAALYATYQAGADGVEVIRKFARPSHG